MSNNRRIACLFCIVAAIALLYPGISQPVLTLSGDIQRADLAEFGMDALAGGQVDSQSRQMLDMISQFLGLDRLEGSIEVYRQTQSIAGFAGELASQGNMLVAMLIVIFSMVVPLLKMLILAIAIAVPATASEPLLRINAALSKWSMADVFVIALLVAFMAGRASGHAGELLRMHAELGPGFYYFLAYCLFSIAAGALLTVRADIRPLSTGETGERARAERAKVERESPPPR
ncbi:MAG: paraquat-inducible protein A [Chromatocurvus sp.]